MEKPVLRIKHEPPKDFKERIDLCEELYDLCMKLKNAPKAKGKKTYPKGKKNT